MSVCVRECQTQELFQMLTSSEKMMGRIPRCNEKQMTTYISVCECVCVCFGLVLTHHYYGHFIELKNV